MLSVGRLREAGSKDRLSPGTVDRVLARVRRPLDRAFESSAVGLDDIAALSDRIGSRDNPGPRTAAPGAPRVLIASLRGWSTHNAYEIAIAQALRLRGAEIALFTCGGGMPACELGWARRAHPRPCDRCAWLTDRVIDATGIRGYRLGDLMPWGDDARRAPRAAGSKEAHARSGVSVAWLLKTTQLDLVPHAREVADDFTVALEGVGHATAAVLRAFEPDVVFLLNGLFGAERTIRQVALGQGVRTPTYEIAPRGGALVLSQDAAAPDYDLDRLWARVKDRPLNERQRSETIGLLEDRARGVGAHESYCDRVEDDPAQLRSRLGLSGCQPIVSLFTNVTWDSATIGHDIAFESMFDWVEQSVRLAAGRDVALVVRIHPAEGRWGTREAVQEAIGSRLGEIPANVRFVAAADALSSYALLDISNLSLTYTTTVGLEAAARGKPVAVAGDTHYRGRGFTIDIASAQDLARVLAAAPQELPAPNSELAERYAHMFFFRAMIPFPAIEAHNGRLKRFPRRAADLAPGADPYLDWICDRIIDGQDFGLPDELACVAATASTGD